MRCLYCGKELALLKRLTGGEFCSDAHRQRYQEEYNQLALNRLLQAKPPGELKSPSTEAKAPESKTPEITKPKDDLRPLETKRAQETPGPGQQPIQERATPPVSPAPAAPPSPEPPGAKPEPEGIAPGFLVDLPVPVMAKVMPMSAPELDLLPSGEREFPQRQFDAVQIEPVAAGKVRFQPLPRVVDCSTRPREKGVELREFPRTTPIVEVRLGPAGETGLETCARPMEIQFLPQPPPESPLWRQEAEKEFAVFGIELGDLARLDFQTTGLLETSEAEASTAPRAAQALAPPLHMVVAETQPPGVPEPPVAEPAVVPLSGETVQKLPESKLQPLPEMVARPLPLTLQGLAAGKAKPVQVFPSAVSSGVGVQLPRSDALPLRPVMILETGKRTTERAIIVKAEPPKQPVSDPRMASSKVRKPEARALEPGKREAERRQGERAPGLKEPSPRAQRQDTPPPPVTSPAPRRETPKDAAPQSTAPQGAAVPPPPAKESNMAAPPPASYSEPDLRLPTLNLTPSESFLSRMPVATKAGVAAVALLAIGGAIFFATKSGRDKAASPAPHASQAGTALPASEAGWITDFAPDPPGGARRRQVSVLRGSLLLNNYRLELQGQIENKALGWVLRARDPRNFYVMKLEIVRPGPDPAVDLVRFAVVNGEEQPRTQIPLSMTVRLDTWYKVRVEAFGDHFTTWIQDQKVDEWTDVKIIAGGVGLYSERGERASLKGGVSVAPLTLK